MPKITKNSTLAEALQAPDAKKILAKHKVPCLTCPFAAQEMNQLTLSQICQTYQLDCAELVQDLNTPNPAAKK